MNIKNNPFYILNLSCNSTRQEIALAAGSPNTSNYSIQAAAAALNHPGSRLSAEMDWFPDIPDILLSAIHAAIDCFTPISCSTFYGTFRHTYITLAASSGIDVKTLQSIAGHSDIKMTMDRYAHKRDEKIIEAGSRIGGVFSSL